MVEALAVATTSQRESVGHRQHLLSVVIPVYNEESILQEAVSQLVYELDELPWGYEVVLAENGSTDRTVEIAERLGKEIPSVRTFSIGEPNYGKALREGILRARGIYVVCDEIDLCDTSFLSNRDASLAR